MDDLESLLGGPVEAISPISESEAHDIRHGFMLGDHRILLPHGTYSEIAAKQSICSLPDCPDWFAGFINHRGHAVPVYDLAGYLKNGKSDLRKNFWVLLLDAHPDTAGFIIHSLPTVLSGLILDAHADTTELPSALSPFIHHVWQRKHHQWHELNHRALLHHLKMQFQLPKQ